MATRMFLAFTQVPWVIAPPDAAWQYLVGQRWRCIRAAHGPDAVTAGNTVGAWTSGNSALGTQFISPPMPAGVVFNTGVTVKGQLMARELASSDNVTQLLAGLRIVSEEGIVRATLLAVANYMGTTEFLSTGHRNKSIFNGDALTGSHTTLHGDRVCLEVGFTDAAGTSPQAAIQVGTSGTDLPENETQTSSGVSWLEFSNTWTFLLEGQHRHGLALMGCGGVG